MTQSYRKTYFILSVKCAALFAFCFLFLSFFFLLSEPGSAQVIGEQAAPQDFGVEEVGQTISLSGTDIRIIIGKIIRAILGLLAIIVLGITLYAGFLIMTSGGNEDSIARGRKMLGNAVVGLIIIFSSLAIVQFFLNAFSGQGGGGGAGQDGGPIINNFGGSGALGKLIKDHYPSVGQIDVPRDTQIVVSFSESIDPASIIDDTNKNNIIGDCTDWKTKYPELPFNAVAFWSTLCDQMKPSAVELYATPSVSGAIPVLISAAALTKPNTAGNTFDFVFKPHQPLGDNNEKIWYTVVIKAGKNAEATSQEGVILKHPITGELSNGYLGPSGFYLWQFQTDTIFDDTPPIVTLVSPSQGQKDKSNKIIRVDFSEAMDPLTAQGVVDQLTVTKTTLDHILFAATNKGTKQNSLILPVGEWLMSNNYKTIEFIPNNPCGQNACGNTIYCIQLDCAFGDTSCTNGYETLLNTADLIDTSAGATSFKSYPFTGITDMANNALDGDADTIPDGKPSVGDIAKIEATECASGSKQDNYCWDYIIQNEKDLVAPYIKKVTPGIDDQDVLGNAPLTLDFSKLMLSSGLSLIDVQEYPGTAETEQVLGTDATGNNITLQDILAQNIGGSLPHTVINTTITSYGGNTTRAIVKPYREFGPYDTDLFYFPTVASTIKDGYQNCLYPGRGPWSASVTNEASPICTYSETGGSTDCVDVTFDSATDTGCVVSGKTTKDDAFLTKENIDSCVTDLKGVSDL